MAEAVVRSRRGLLMGLGMLPLIAARALTVPTQSSQSGKSATGPTVVFDVNETLLNFGVLAPVFVRIFNDSRMLREWFNQVVLYSEALTLAGEYTDSGTVGVAVLGMLAEIQGRPLASTDLEELKQLAATMPTYPDTPGALERLRKAGLRLVTLSNNPTLNVEAQLSAAGLRSCFERLYSIDEDGRRYKPARESYVTLAAKLGARASELWLVSCHAFDTLGAASAGYRTALILRPENAPIGLGKAPDIVETDLRILADRIIEKTGARRDR
jgi:2-haloacid dehalogenase